MIKRICKVLLGFSFAALGVSFGITAPEIICNNSHLQVLPQCLIFVCFILTSIIFFGMGLASALFNKEKW